jgi:CheY-like chemotaxis protein
MPEMNGYELVDRAKSERGDLKIILLSGIEADAHGYPLVRKPFLQRDLVHTMQHATGLC